MTPTDRPTPPVPAAEDDYQAMPGTPEAISRVLQFVGWFGDGLIDGDPDGFPLYARDLEAVARAALDAATPVVPDSAGLRSSVAARVAFEEAGARLMAVAGAYATRYLDTLGRVVAAGVTVRDLEVLASSAVVGQGVTAEQRDEAIRAATREVAKQARSWPGDGLLHDVPPVEAADAAVRAALESLGISRVVRPTGQEGS